MYFSAQSVNVSIYPYLFKALTIGYNLSIGPIFLLTEFNQDVSIIGILFAAGASCGTILAVSATLTTPGKWFFNKYLPVLACLRCLYSYALLIAPAARDEMIN